MRVLVTGGAGFVGSVLVPHLLQQDHYVRALDSLMYGGTGLLPNFRNPQFDFVKGDIRDRQAVQNAMQDCDACIHLAAIVGFPACRIDPALSESVNFDGSKIIAEVAGKDRLILYASTGSNYGEIEDEICTEETPLRPLSIYGKTKTAAEQYLLEHATTIGFRFATAFGLSPRLRLDLLINDFVYTAIKMRYLVVYESHFMRTFIHIHDMARAFAFALDHADQMKGQIYNVGSETMNYSKAEICDMIRRKVEYYLHLADVGEDTDKRNYVVSYKKINRLGFQTSVTLEEGIEELVRAFEIVDFRNPYSNA